MDAKVAPVYVTGSDDLFEFTSFFHSDAGSILKNIHALSIYSFSIGVGIRPDVFSVKRVVCDVVFNNTFPKPINYEQSCCHVGPSFLSVTAGKSTKKPNSPFSRPRYPLYV